MSSDSGDKNYSHCCYILELETGQIHTHTLACVLEAQVHESMNPPQTITDVCFVYYVLFDENVFSRMNN